MIISDALSPDIVPLWCSSFFYYPSEWRASGSRNYRTIWYMKHCIVQFVTSAFFVSGLKAQGQETIVL
jgi:hypothetical protein